MLVVRFRSVVCYEWCVLTRGSLVRFYAVCALGFVQCFVCTVRCVFCFFFFQAEDGIRDADVTGVQTCALPISGTYTLTANRIGYAKQSQSVTVAAGQEVTTDLVLQAAATELEQVIVTGTVVPTDRKSVV